MNEQLTEIVPMQVEVQTDDSLNSTELASGLFACVGKVISNETGSIIIEPFAGRGPNGIRCVFKDDCVYPPKCKREESCAG